MWRKCLANRHSYRELRSTASGNYGLIMQAKLLPLVVLVSGNGSNLQAILDAIALGILNVEVRAVISNEPDAYALMRARNAGVVTEILSHRDFATRTDYDAALITLIDLYQPNLIVLAGFMRILSALFITHFRGQIINIHPALLPAFRGLHTHARALAAGVKEHGATVHFVTEELDSGPIVLQAKVPVFADDNAEILAARVLIEEHRIYPEAISWFATGRLCLDGNGNACLDGKVLPIHGYI